MLAPNANESGILFGNPTNSANAGIVYSGLDGDLQFRNAGNTSRMKIDSSGNVTKPAQASFNAYTPAVTTGGNTIIFGSERHDTGSNYDTSTGIFTAPVAGVYQFHAYVLFSPGSAQYGRILFRINNVGSSMETYGDTLTLSLIHISEPTRPY